MIAMTKTLLTGTGLLLGLTFLLWMAERDAKVQVAAEAYRSCIEEQQGVSVERCRDNNNGILCTCYE